MEDEKVCAALHIMVLTEKAPKKCFQDSTRFAVIKGIFGVVHHALAG
jgi:hypothetical protein